MKSILVLGFLFITITVFGQSMKEKELLFEAKANFEQHIVNGFKVHVVYEIEQSAHNNVVGKKVGRKMGTLRMHASRILLEMEEMIYLVDDDYSMEIDIPEREVMINDPNETEGISLVPFIELIDRDNYMNIGVINSKDNIQTFSVPADEGMDIVKVEFEIDVSNEKNITGISLFYENGVIARYSLNAYESIELTSEDLTSILIGYEDRGYEIYDDRED